MKLRQLDHKEVLLRSLFALLFLGLILGYSMDKILIAFNLKQADTNVVSLKIDNLDKGDFPAWPSFICGQGITSVIAQTIKRGASGAEDVRIDLPNDYITQKSTVDLAPGDWTGRSGPWPCFVFNSNKQLNFTPGVIDQIILVASTDQPNVQSTPTGLLFGIFDAVRTMSTVDPFVGPIPSRNTFTFTKNQRYDVDNRYFSYFFVNKQNIIPEPAPFENNVIATFAYSPDTYLTTTYTEKRPVTPYVLLSAVGGLITYAIACWVILFGRGKYRSWGLIQRYLLRNSPDAKKNDNKHRLLPVPNTPSELESQKNNIETVGTKSDIRPASAFYFTSSGNPNQANLNPLSPNSTITSPSGSIQSKDMKELVKLIDAKINQKLWFVEQTLSRHYLSGFRLRRYDVDLNKMGLTNPYDEPVEEILTPRHSWNMSAPLESKNIQATPPPQNLTPHSSQYFQKNSANSSNPEERRSQYPNIAIGQVPSERKKGNGVNGNNGGVAYDGSYPSNLSVPPSYMQQQSSYTQLPLQTPYATHAPPIHSDNSNINPTHLSQLQTPYPQGGYNGGHEQGPEVFHT